MLRRFTDKQRWSREMQKRLVRVTLAAFVLVGSIPFSPSALAADSCGSTTLSAEAAAVLLRTRINAERSAAGVPSLQRYWDLEDDAVSFGIPLDAKSWAQAMASAGSISHNPHLARVATRATALGENVGKSHATTLTGDVVCRLHAAFMKSPNHRKNVLNAGYNAVGIAWAVSAKGVFVAVEFAHVPFSGFAAGRPPFHDDEGTRHEAAIEALFRSGATRGCALTITDRRFCPGASVTRAGVAGPLAKVLKLPAAPHDYFRDDDGMSAEKALNALARAGILKGCNPPRNDRVCPTSRITRAQIATVLMRAFSIPPASRDYFTDDATSVHQRAINAMYAAGITKGCNAAQTRFCPTGVVTNAELASFLIRGARRR
jgi:uncharacterized protein YkwD